MKSDDVHKNLQALEAKICKVRQARDGVKGADAFGRRSAVGFGVRVATDLLAAVLVGAGLGWLLDIFFGTRSVMLVVFLLFGGIAGFVNVYRAAKSEEKKGN